MIAGELDWCGLDRALADGNVEGFVGIPACMVVLQLPLRGGHETGLLAGKINAGALAVAEFRWRIWRFVSIPSLSASV